MRDSHVGVRVGRSQVVVGRNRQVSATGVVFSQPGRQPSPRLCRYKPVSDVADGTDQSFVFRAELCPQSPDVHINRPGAAEVVVTPDFLEQLRSGEDPTGVLGKELQQLKLLE